MSIDITGNGFAGDGINNRTGVGDILTHISIRSPARDSFIFAKKTSLVMKNKTMKRRLIMIIEALALIVLFGGAACTVALICATKEKLDERLYGVSEDHESSEW